MADLFGTKSKTISKHLKNIFKSRELAENSTCCILEHVAKNVKIYKFKFNSLAKTNFTGILYRCDL